MCQLMHYEHFSAGDLIIKQNSRNNLLCYCIVEGTVRLHHQTLVLMDPKKNLSHLSPEEKSRSAKLDVAAIVSQSQTKISTAKELIDRSILPNESSLRDLSHHDLKELPENSFQSHADYVPSKLSLMRAPSDQKEPFSPSNFKSGYSHFNLIRGRKEYVDTATQIKLQGTEEHLESFPKTPLKRNADYQYLGGEGFTKYIANLDYNSMNLDEIRIHLEKYQFIKQKSSHLGCIDDNYLLILRKHLGRVVREMPEGSTFGERGIQGSILRTASVVAKTNCHVLALPLKKFQFALKAVAKEKASKKFNLLAGVVPDCSTLSYEQYFQFQYHFHEKQTVKDTILLPEGKKGLFPCLISFGECIAYKENNSFTRSKLATLIKDLEGVPHLEAIQQLLKDLLMNMINCHSKVIYLGVVGPGELAGSEIIYPEIGESLFSYRVTTSELEYFVNREELSPMGTRQIQALVAPKLKHRINIIRMKINANKKAKLQITEESKLEASTSVAAFIKRSPAVAYDGKLQRTQVRLMIKSDFEPDSHPAGTAVHKSSNKDGEESPKKVTIMKPPQAPNFASQMRSQIKSKSKEDGIIDYLKYREATRPHVKTILEQDDDTSRPA